VEIKPIAPDDPSGTILIEQKSVLEEKYPGQYSNAGIAERYLVDPSRGYITLRHEIDFTGPDAKKEGFFPTQTEIYEMKDYRKTPKGFWYPAKVCRSFRNNSPSASKKIEPAQTYNFFLDFSRILPDELFRPDSASQGGK
jgi:hypothetical protein